MTTACAQAQIWNLREVARAKRGGFYFYGNYSIELLMVGGGGGGGSWMGGAGGGAGGIIYTNDLPVLAGTCFPVIVGSGGSSGIGGSRGSNTTFCYTPTAGGSAICITAQGGGGGFGPPFSPTPTGFQNLPHPCIVGSGGGGGKKSPLPAPSVPAPFQPQINCFTTDGGLAAQNQPALWGNLPGVSGFGCPGGNACISSPTVPTTPHCMQGGGGGAGAAGTPASITSPTAFVAGNGGNGLTYSISGSSVGYAGGGGAGIFTSWPWPGTCGGCGALTFGGDGWNNPTRVLCGPFPPEGQGCLVYLQGAIANRGGGGGGGAGVGPRGGAGGSCGGSGIVIIRYDGLQKGSGGNTITTCFSPTTKTIHTFTGSGCFVA